VGGSLTTVASKSAKNKLDLVALQEVKWDNGGSQAASLYLRE